MKIDKKVDGKWISVIGENRAECEAKMAAIIGVDEKPEKIDSRPKKTEDVKPAGRQNVTEKEKE